ncbi:MAG: hypothetical protein L0Z68_02795 [Gammaproteobacteria bacterium]|nr:hypothetical protein [Gammaproteobacteria bacterium]
MVGQIRNDSIVITGIGMVSSLAHDAATSCAAYRAALSGASQLDGRYIFNEEQNEFESVVGHQIPIVLNGFEGFARVLCIGWYALQDLLARIDIQAMDPSRTGLHLALPIAWSRLKEIAEQEAQLNLIDGADSSGRKRSGGDSGSFELLLCARLAELAQIRIPKQHWRTFESGHAGFAVALAAAMQDLREGRLTRCIVAGLDSLIDATALQWLSDNELLKTEQNPVGLQPGEAGAVVCLETYATAQLRNAHVLAKVAAVALGHEPSHFFSGEQSLGKGLADTVTQLLTMMPRRVVARRWVITDQTGEPHRANEWGHALVRLVASKAGFEDAVTTYPAISFGDTGAASGGLSICSVVTAFLRGYAVSDDAIITSCSYDGKRAAAYITQESN